MDEFRKRFFRTPSELFRIIFSIISFRIGHVRRARKTNREYKVSPTFAEKLMLAISGVNDCVYCSYRHTKTSLEKGISEAEIRDLLSGSLVAFPEEEAIGIAYAQHWAECQGNPSEKARRRVVDYYGEEKTRYMEMLMKAVYLGNMCCNTVEAYRKKIEIGSGKARFFFTYLVCAPLAFFILRSGHREGVPRPSL